MTNRSPQPSDSAIDLPPPFGRKKHREHDADDRGLPMTERTATPPA